MDKFAVLFDHFGRHWPLRPIPQKIHVSLLQPRLAPQLTIGLHDAESFFLGSSLTDPDSAPLLLIAYQAFCAALRIAYYVAPQTEPFSYVGFLPRVTEREIQTSVACCLYFNSDLAVLSETPSLYPDVSTSVMDRYQVFLHPDVDTWFDAERWQNTAFRASNASVRTWRRATPTAFTVPFAPPSSLHKQLEADGATRTDGKLWLPPPGSTTDDLDSYYVYHLGASIHSVRVC